MNKRDIHTGIVGQSDRYSELSALIKTNMKRIIFTILLAIAVITAGATNSADNTTDFDFCEPNAEGTMLYYRYMEQSYCELVAGPEKYTGIITIPPYVTEQQIPVIGVGFKAFYDCEGLTEVHLPFTMLYLETASFYMCRDLQKVELNENLKAIGWNAFEGCQELTSLNIPQSLEYMGYEALYGCLKMTTPLYNDKYFFNYPMYRWSMDETYSIPEGIEVIGEGAFIFTKLQEVVIPNSVKTISDYAFDGSSIQRVNIPTSVESIGYQAFGQTRIEEVVVPASVKSFGQRVFYSAFQLKKAVLENPLDSIPTETFANCIELTEVSYPATVHKLGDYSFYQCMSLTELPDLSNIDTLGISVFYGFDALESVLLPTSITYIPDETFSMSENIKEVYLHDSIERIGASAFYHLSSLESIKIPTSVTSIGSSAFSFCENLRTIDFSEGLITIGNYAFSHLDQLESISLPKSVESIGYLAFAFGYKLKDVYVKWQDPLVLQNDIFDSYQHTLGMTLHVPPGSAERYANAEYWSNFNNIVEDATAIENITIDNKSIRYSKPIKRLINGKVIIESKSSGKVLVDGRKISYY